MHGSKYQHFPRVICITTEEIQGKGMSLSLGGFVSAEVLAAKCLPSAPEITSYWGWIMFKIWAKSGCMLLISLCIRMEMYTWRVYTKILLLPCELMSDQGAFSEPYTERAESWIKITLCYSEVSFHSTHALPEVTCGRASLSKGPNGFPSMTSCKVRLSKWPHFHYNLNTQYESTQY